jgi:hypothetical protein
MNEWPEKTRSVLDGTCASRSGKNQRHPNNDGQPVFEEISGARHSAREQNAFARSKCLLQKVSGAWHLSRMSSSRLTAVFFGLLFFTRAVVAQQKLPVLDQVLESKIDLWGEAAMREPDGASYEFFEKLLPPPRYVNADFRYYPIVLSAPNAKVKARLISNGSGVNLRGGSRSWNDVGMPAIFRVGPDEFQFGGILERLRHPKLAEGFLPIVQIDYGHPTPKHDSAKTAAQPANEEPEIYRLEAFASTDPTLAENGVVFVSFSIIAGSNGVITVETENKPALKITSGGKLLNEKGETLVWFDKSWNLERQLMHARLTSGKNATLAIATKPLGTNIDFHFSNDTFLEQRQKSEDTWKKILSRAVNIETPEPIVNNAWRNLVVQQFAICSGSNLNYSAGNQYQKMYAAETSDAAVPLMSFGYEDDMRHFLPVILNLRDPRLTNHFASHKLNTLCKFFWQTRDVESVKAMRPRWQVELDWILNNRNAENGLLPKDNYCTDIEQPVYSLGANAKCWAALRDMIPVLEAIGDVATAKRVSEIAIKYKADILAAADQSIRHETEPPFVPMALFGAEDIHDPIVETRIGSYWDLVAGYIIGSGIFVRTEKETWIPKYLETHGGLCMGLTRSGADNHSFWIGKHRTNPLYGMRYITDALRRGDVERALVSFYGMLAHGMTRNTFIGAEGCALQPIDDGGRQFYCPPNTASNGQWLNTLRNLLIQDFDMGNDGRPETLRLAFATPQRWLEDGKQIKVERAPTAFGPVSFNIQSSINRNEVIAEIDLPARNEAKQIFFRVRLPNGWKALSATAAGVNLKVDEKGTVDISALRGKVILKFVITKA